MRLARQLGWLCCALAIAPSWVHAQEAAAVQPPAAAPPAEAPAPPPEPDPSSDDALLVRWSARIMPGYGLERTHPSADQAGRERDRYGVFLDQARLEIELERGMLEGEASLELADAIAPPTSRPAYLRDAFLGARFTKALRLRAGHFKRPFSRIELTSSGVLPVRGRGLTNGLIVDDAGFGGRALGLMLWGKLKGDLAYYAELSNAGWPAEANRGATGNLRATWSPWSWLSLGADGAYQHRVQRGGDDRSYAFGVDARWKVGSLTAVLDARAGRLPATNLQLAIPDPPFAYGIAGYASYDLALGGGRVLQPTLFAELADNNTDFARDEAVRGVAGLNLVFPEGLRIMPQVEIVRSLKDASAQSAWKTSEAYYLLLSAEL